ncbi:MAG TPA: MFS transporter, partial [Candidatus Nanoarchaeia archaeon]|nr:MFS transporter [Candidatus Nanoarchaeia archaeon]
MDKSFENNPKKSLKCSLYDGAFFALMDGLTASFLTPFAVALNASVSLIAALTYVPQLVGAFAQLFATKLSDVIKSRKKIVLIGTFMQSLLWLPLLLIPYISPGQSYLLLVYVSLSALFLQATQPIGTAWIGDLVPQNERGKFFGLRNKIVGICSFVATLLAGGLLIYLSPLHPFLGFTIIFS